MLHYFVKAGIILFYFLIFPMLAGMAFQEFCKKKQVSFGECYIRGWLLMSLLGLAVFLPAIRFGMYFTYTVFVWIGVSAAAVAGFVIYLGGRGFHILAECAKEIRTWKWQMFLVLALFLALSVCSILFVIPEYSDNTPETILITQATNTMYKYNPYNSELYGGVPNGAPMVMFYAAVCQMTGMTIRNFVHYVLPIFLLPLFFSVYHKISRQLFFHEEKKQALFLTFVLVFYAASMYTVRNAEFGVFQNIWEPETVLYQVLLPYGVSVCVPVMNHCTNRKKMEKDFLYRELPEVILPVCASQFVYHTGASMQIVIIITAAVIVCARRIGRKCRE